MLANVHDHAACYLVAQASGAAPGFCMRCRVEKATRVCDQCVFDARGKHAWGGGKWHLCFVCFAVSSSERCMDVYDICPRAICRAQLWLAW